MIPRDLRAVWVSAELSFEALVCDIFTDAFNKTP
jgi:hypothetical protein